MLTGKDLNDFYPQEYDDSFLYSPSFAILLIYFLIMRQMLTKDEQFFHTLKLIASDLDVSEEKIVLQY